MTTAQEYRDRAEKILEDSQYWTEGSDEYNALIAQAQVYATLATSAPEVEARVAERPSPSEDLARLLDIAQTPRNLLSQAEWLWYKEHPLSMAFAMEKPTATLKLVAAWLRGLE